MNQMQPHIALGIALCDTLEDVLTQSLHALNTEWQHITKDFMELASASGPEHSPVIERMMVSIQYHDRYNQIMENTVRALYCYRTLLSSNHENAASLLETMMASIQLDGLEKNFHHMMQYGPSKVGD